MSCLNCMPSNEIAFAAAYARLIAFSNVGAAADDGQHTAAGGDDAPSLATVPA